ncbi:MAG TPA: hypothetical protein VH063_09420 [Gaiellaceae bacterium]|nr:hypothetical protein [Gaiellaceae bacterium]
MTRRAATSAIVLLGYAAVSFLYFGRPIVSHPGRYLIGYGRDPQIFVWSFAWYLHALETWQNPFVSHAIYAPTGINLVWATSVPGLSLLFAPVTAIFGPAVSYNLAAMLVPAVSAWTAYLLCRHLTQSLWASLVGGYLFGFSSYMLGQEQGHLHMTAVFLLPLIALVTIRYLQGELSGRGVAWRLGLLFGLEVWLSTEVVVTAALVLGLSLALSYWILPQTRSRLRGSLRPLLEAVGVAALVAAPLLVYAVIGFQGESINDPAIFDGDTANFLLPTHLVWFGGSWFTSLSYHFRGGDAEAGAYLGLPTLAIVAWYAVGARRSRVARYLLASLAVAALLTLGTGIVWRGHIDAWLPWRLVARLPILDNVLPTRFALYGSLAAAVIVAVWTAARRGWARWVLPALAVAALVPDLSHADYRNHPERWPFFTEGIYKVCFPKGENIAIFPFGYRDNSTLWQAESGFWFRMPDGYLAPTPPKNDIDGDPVIQMLTDTNDNPTPAEIIGLVHRKKIDRIVSVDIYVHPNGVEMHRFGSLQDVGGVGVAPACGYPSMQKGIHPTPIHPPH